jgi:hypothetical protein
MGSIHNLLDFTDYKAQFNVFSQSLIKELAKRVIRIAVYFDPFLLPKN